jgi:hypothetical protein
MRDNLVLLCYIDDCLILCKDEAKIEQVVKDLKQQFTLEDQGEVAAYIGICMTSFISNGVQLIPRVINSIGLIFMEHILTSCIRFINVQDFAMTRN